MVPTLTASTSDSPLLAAPPSNGVLLNLSDGLHCTYVQVPPADADALRRSMGLKMEQLKAELKQLED